MTQNGPTQNNWLKIPTTIWLTLNKKTQKDSLEIT